MDYKRIAAYVRVSTEEQKNHGISVEAQIASITEWAKKNNHTIVDIYNDAGLSARKPASSRPELQRLLSDIRLGKIDMVVFTKLDRWFRNVKEYYKVQDILDEHGVTWFTILEDYETETTAGRLKTNIMLAVAQDEADRTSDRIKTVFEHKREIGEVISGSVPFGFKMVDKKIIHDPETEAAVYRFFTLSIQLRSVRAAAKQVRIETGVIIGNNVAYKMRKNTAYIGQFHHIAVPPYITKEQQEQIQANIGKAPRNQNHVVKLFPGIAVCGKCGGRMIAHTITANGNTYISYHCSRYSNRLECDSKTSMSERKIETQLLDTLDSVIEDALVSASLRQTEHTTDYDADIERINRKLKKLKDLYMDDLIDITAYKSDYTDLMNQKQALEAKKANTKKQPEIVRLPANWKETYDLLDRKGKAEFWGTVIDTIIINGDRTIEVKPK